MKNKKDEFFEIEILNWDKYQRAPRKDVKHSSWFAFYNDFFEDDKVFHLTVTQKLIFIYLLSLKSKLGRSEFTVSPKLIRSRVQVNPKLIRDAILRLEEFQLVRVISRNVYGTYNTNKQTLQQKVTDSLRLTHCDSVNSAKKYENKFTVTQTDVDVVVETLKKFYAGSHVPFQITREVPNLIKTMGGKNNLLKEINSVYQATYSKLKGSEIPSDKHYSYKTLALKRALGLQKEKT